MTNPQGPNDPTDPTPDESSAGVPDATTPIERSAADTDQTQSLDATKSSDSPAAVDPPTRQETAGDLPPDHGPPPGWVPPMAAAPVDQGKRGFGDRAKGAVTHRAAPVVAALLVGAVLGSGVTALVAAGHDGGRGNHTSQMQGDDRRGPGGSRDQGGPGNGGPGNGGPSNGGPGIGGQNGGPANDDNGSGADPDTDGDPTGDTEGSSGN